MLWVWLCRRNGAAGEGPRRAGHWAQHLPRRVREEEADLGGGGTRRCVCAEGAGLPVTTSVYWVCSVKTMTPQEVNEGLGEKNKRQKHL